MLQQTLTIRNKLGLHARPSALLAKTAGLFKSSITLTSGSRSVDAKSILGLMTMAMPCGTELTISAEGPDEKAALESIVELFENRFGEEE
ncbi:HPr family phosphocarrier protein [Sutterella sp.]|uniref:HPr family phosphocarrier protein n=1 Tax=Sutterella sp. TaxID=1981025 RepID=UPI003FD74FA0